MPRHQQFPAARADGNRSALPLNGSLDDEALTVQVRAYLEYCSQHLDPPPALMGAWENFYHGYSRRVWAFLRRFQLTVADREDCLQDVWARVIDRLADGTFDANRGRLSTWMLTIARNRAIDALRHRRVSAESIADQFAIADARAGTADVCDQLGDQEEVRIALAVLSAELPALSYKVLYLRVIEGQTTAEVADALHLTAEQVRLRLHRGRRKLRTILESGNDKGY